MSSHPHPSPSPSHPLPLPSVVAVLSSLSPHPIHPLLTLPPADYLSLPARPPPNKSPSPNALYGLNFASGAATATNISTTVRNEGQRGDSVPEG